MTKADDFDGHGFVIDRIQGRIVADDLAVNVVIAILVFLGKAESPGYIAAFPSSHRRGLPIDQQSL